MPRSCRVCQAKATKKCSGCQNAWYCSQACQHRNWAYHIFKCKHSKRIPPAYYLLQATAWDEFPKDKRTLEDYGFTKVWDADDRSNLLGVYRDLFAYVGVKPGELHRWWKEGVLVQEAKKVFEKTPFEKRGPHYPWFVKNERFLDPNWDPIQIIQVSRRPSEIILESLKCI